MGQRHPFGAAFDESSTGPGARGGQVCQAEFESGVHVAGGSGQLCEGRLGAQEEYAFDFADPLQGPHSLPAGRGEREASYVGPVAAAHETGGAGECRKGPTLLGAMVQEGE